MNYGLYLSASGVLSNQYRQDVFANNLANVETVGFKRDIATVRQRDPETAEDGFGFHLRKAVLDRIGGGSFAGPQHIALGQGPLERTDGKLDVAIEGDNAFFAVRTPNGVGLTRDGRFGPDAQGRLVLATSGQPVLDVEDQPIRIDLNQPVHIDDRGAIRQGGQVVAQLQVTAVRDPRDLVKRGHGLVGWQSASDPRMAPASFRLRQGYVEGSGVQPIKALMDLTGATKAASGNARMIRFHDDLMSRAVNTLGRVR